MKLIATHVVSQNESDAPLGVVRVHCGLIDAKKQNRQERFFRREYVTVKNLATGSKVVRKVMGHNHAYDEYYKKAFNMPFPKEAVALDYEARDALGIRDIRATQELVIYRTTLAERASYYWNSDEPAVRIANRLGAIAIVVSMKDFIDLVEMVAGWVTRLIG